MGVHPQNLILIGLTLTHPYCRFVIRYTEHLTSPNLSWFCVRSSVTDMRSFHAKLRLRPIWITPAVLCFHAPWPQGQTSYTYHIAQSAMRWWRQDSDVIDMLTLEDDEVHLVSWRRFNHPQCKQHQWSFGRKSMNLRNVQSLLWITTFRSPGFALDHTFHVHSLWGPIINYINKSIKVVSTELDRL